MLNLLRFFRQMGGMFYAWWMAMHKFAKRAHLTRLALSSAFIFINAYVCLAKFDLFMSNLVAGGSLQTAVVAGLSILLGVILEGVLLLECAGSICVSLGRIATLSGLKFNHAAKALREKMHKVFGNGSPET